MIKSLIIYLYKETSIGFLLIHPIKVAICFGKYWLISDARFIQKLYRKKFGVYPNLKNPKRLSEKIQWLKLNDRTPLHTICADKYKVRSYVKNKIGEEYLIPLVLETTNISEINAEDLPDCPVIVKANHDSGGTFIINDKIQIDFKKLQRHLRRVMAHNYYYENREWPYKNIKKRVIVEKLMIDDKYDQLYDYKIHCMNGKVKFVEIMTDRGSENGIKEHCLDINYNKQPFLFSYPQSDKAVDKPDNWNEMLEKAECLAQGLTYVRVDMYSVNGKTYFGEMTFHPHSGTGMYLQPREWDEKLGQMLKL